MIAAGACDPAAPAGPKEQVPITSDLIRTRGMALLSTAIEAKTYARGLFNFELEYY